MTTKMKMKRVRWTAALTLALLLMSLASPLLMRFLPTWLPDFDPIVYNRPAEWEGVFDLIYVFLILLLFVCIAVFFVRLFRGLKQGKIFVPGNARWLYVGALLPIISLIYRAVSMLFLHGASGLAVAAFITSVNYNVALFLAITLMALLYDVATDVSEENQLTV